MDVDWRRTLRGAMARADGPGVVAALGDSVPDDYLQLAGDGLLLALAQQSPGADELALRCAESLSARGWTGDHELATALGAALGRAPVSLLSSLAVDPEEVSELIESDEGGRINRETGEVWTQSAIDYAEDDELAPEDDERWLHVWGDGSVEGYRDMEVFIANLSDPEVADRLAIAIDGKGAFRRFKDVLSRWPDVEDGWYRFSDERRRGRARAWLADAGYRPAMQSGRG